MISFKTDVQNGKQYSITIDTDNSYYFHFIQDIARALIDGKHVTVEFAKPRDFEVAVTDGENI